MSCFVQKPKDVQLSFTSEKLEPSNICHIGLKNWYSIVKTVTNQMSVGWLTDLQHCSTVMLLVFVDADLTI